MNVIVFLVLLVMSLVVASVSVKKGANPKKVIIAQIASFVIIFGVSLFIPSTVFAAGSASSSAQAANQAGSLAQGLGYLGMALAIGLGSVGSGLAVAAAAPAAIGATSEDPKAFGKSIVFVGMAEGVAVFGLLISIFINGHLS